MGVKKPLNPPKTEWFTHPVKTLKKSGGGKKGDDILESKKPVF